MLPWRCRPLTAVVDGRAGEGRKCLFKRRQQWSGVLLRQRRERRRAPQYRPNCSRRPWRKAFSATRAAAPMQPAKSSVRSGTRSSSHCASMTVRIRVLVAGSNVHRCGRKRFWRNADDLRLIRHQPKQRSDFVSIADRNGPQAQIAGIGIDIRKRRKRSHAARFEMPAGLAPAASVAADRRHCRSSQRKARRK